MALGDPPARAGDTTNNLFAGFTESINEFIARIPFAVLAVFTLVLSYFIAKVVQKSITNTVLRQGEGEEQNVNAATMLGRAGYYIVMVIGFTVSLNIIDIDISLIVGALTFGLGFAMKDLIGNYIAGIVILLQKPIRIGDLVKIDDYMGYVQRIESRTTEVKTLDGQNVVIPNSFIFSNSLTNYSTYPERRMNLIVGVHYNTDLQKAKEALEKVLTADERVLANPQSVIQFEEFSSSSIHIKAKLWIHTTTDIFQFRSDIIQKIKAAFDEAGITIPFPMRTIVFEKENGIEKLKPQPVTIEAQENKGQEIKSSESLDL